MPCNVTTNEKCLNEVCCPRKYEAKQLWMCRAARVQTGGVMRSHCVTHSPDLHRGYVHGTVLVLSQYGHGASTAYFCYALGRSRYVHIKLMVRSRQIQVRSHYAHGTLSIDPGTFILRSWYALDRSRYVHITLMVRSR